MADTFARAIPTPGALAPSTDYDRTRWEERVLASRTLHHNARFLALVLSHHADASGRLPAGGIQHASRLAARTHLPGKQVRISLTALELAGFLTRPDLATWEAREVVRPITLTYPTAPARQEPPAPGAPR
ncbi:hypothetical protein [Streptomyces sp. NPDC006997]|uniref:hypothetical protein n=1 Tax=Streptomyces sp. NPDC006997 TaxID=3155356 RepID=UPI0033C0296C